MKKRILSIIIVIAICMNMMPSGAMASAQNDVTTCSHHPVHTEDCGYTEEEGGASCTHEHTEECYEIVTDCVHEHTDVCYLDMPETTVSGSDAGQPEQTDGDQASGTEEYAEPGGYLNCEHVCGVESECITAALQCQHEHDSACGYAEAVSGQPCGYVCNICPVQEMIEKLPKKVTKENREETAALIRDILERYQALSDEEREQVDLSRCEELGAMLEEDEEFDVPYYLFIVHSLSVEGEQYGSAELIELQKNDFTDGLLDLYGYALNREGMKTVRVSYLDMETYDLKESSSVSLADFVEAGDPSDGSNYYAVQILMEYGVADGYRAILPENPRPADDPYGIMPLTGFTGSDIKDITFVPASIVNITVRYMYSPTGGLAGLSAASSAEHQVLLEEGKAVTEHWDIPYANGNNYRNLDGFRIVLDPKPLNAFLNNPDLADEMTDNPDPETIKTALENDEFSIDPNSGVYSDAGHPAGNYGNGYSKEYNEAWNRARAITESNNLYTAAAASRGEGSATVGANALTDPVLTVTIPVDQVQRIMARLTEIANVEDAAKKAELQRALEDDLTITVYYRRNVGSYEVAHWVGNLPTGMDANALEKKEKDGKIYYKVYDEVKQGRVGAMTNAVSRAGENITGSFDFAAYVTEGFGQQIIQPNGETTVDIFYKPASAYRIIFNTNDTYIPRVQADLGDRLVFNYTNGSLMIKKDNNGEEKVTSYINPARVGYKFVGWQYEVRNGGNNEFRNIKDEFSLTADNIANLVIANDDPTINAIYLYPRWEPAEASVRVVFWTEDLSGGIEDAKVKIEKPAGTYEERVRAYTGGTPDKVGSSFSNMGSFTFEATTGQTLNLSVSNKTLTNIGTMDTFTVSDPALDDGKQTDTLAKVIGAMFEIRMPKVKTLDPQKPEISTSQFYYPYQINKKNNESVTVSADGTTVINVYYARNVYSVDFAYYGEIGGNTSVSYQTNGYSLLNNPENYDSNIGLKSESSDGTGLKNKDDKEWFENKWLQVAGNPNWNVPEKVTITAKYDADIAEIWPSSNGEEIGINPQDGSDTATFISWATTAGPYNARYVAAYENDGNKEDKIEPTIMSVYGAMSADIIADPENTNTIHHMYAYWWHRDMSYYRYHHCYEVPGLIPEMLLKASGVKSFDLNSREFGNSGAANQMSAEPIEKNRRNTIYLVPVNSSVLKEYFTDYSKGLIKVNEQCEEDSNGNYYAVRQYDEKVYAIVESVIARSSDTIARQNPSARMNFTRANNIADHDTRASDQDGNFQDVNKVKLGSEEAPYDLFFYYDRARFTITYMVPARDSETGEYTLGTQKVPFGSSLSRYNVELDKIASSSEIKKLYSNDSKFRSFWTASAGNEAMIPTADSVNSAGYARIVPNSAINGAGTWTFGGWKLNLALTADADWNDTVTGNLRVYANWNSPTYKVTFDLDGGVVSSGNGSSSADIVYMDIPANQGFTSSGKAIPRPLKNGYILAGWNWYPEGVDTKYDKNKLNNFTFDTPITGNMVAVADWTTFQAKNYNYKVWYLTNDPDAVRAAGGDFVQADESGNPGKDDAIPAGISASEYKYVLGCEFFKEQKYPEGTSLLLGTKSFPGYIPYNGNAKIDLTTENTGATAANTQYTAYFYYDKAQVKKYEILFQPIRISDGANDGAVLEGITQTGETDEGYFSPSDESFRALKEAGYQLVMMNADGSVVMENGEPKAASSVSDLRAFIEAENKKFAGTEYGQTVQIIFKVMPIPYGISYGVGTLKTDGEEAVIASEESLRAALQKVVDALVNKTDSGAVSDAAYQNPTAYDVSVFRGNFSFTLKNPVYVQDPENEKIWWKFTGWSAGGDTQEITGRMTRGAAQGEYPSLTIDYAVGDLTFLANWERLDTGLAVADVLCEKQIDGRDFRAGDSFTFTLTAQGDAPKPKGEAGTDVSEVTITPDGGNLVNVPFGRFYFEQEGVYVYTLEEQPGNAPGMTYDTEPRKITLTVTKGADGQLAATCDTESVRWTNVYKETEPADDPNDSSDSNHSSNRGGPDNRSSSDVNNDVDTNDNFDPEKSSDSTNSKLPQTGMLWWPVWLLAISGVIMAGIGIARKRVSGEKDEE